MSLFNKNREETIITDPSGENNYSVAVDSNQPQAIEVKENILAGAIGALLGSLIGVVAILLISQLGYVAAISGIIMGICALKGYELLAKKISVKGIIISSLIALLMVFFAHMVDYAIAFSKYMEISFFEGFEILKMALSDVPEFLKEFYAGLGMLYMFTLLGLVPTIVQKIKEHKIQS